MKHELEKISWGAIPISVYRGCVVERLIGGYKIFGQKVSKPEQVDEVIDSAADHLKNSLTVSNNGNFTCTNDEK